VKLVIQRVSRAEVRVEGSAVGSIRRGLLVFLAIEKGDTRSLAETAAEKVAALRIFPEPGSSKMNLAVGDVGGGVLVVSQFTLAGSLRRGRRPSFDGAAPPEEASSLCDAFAESLRLKELPVSTGSFGAMMEVELVNDGPVTFWLESGSGGEFGP
jgi:D-tyrosyl-tRNA(Tyr) deacylase